MRCSLRQLGTSTEPEEEKLGKWNEPATLKACSCVLAHRLYPVVLFLAGGFAAGWMQAMSRGRLDIACAACSRTGHNFPARRVEPRACPQRAAGTERSGRSHLASPWVLNELHLGEPYPAEFPAAGSHGLTLCFAACQGCWWLAVERVPLGRTLHCFNPL